MVRIGERMTEKRFYLDENGINDREYEFSILGEDELVDIINELNDENKKLKLKNMLLKKEIAHLKNELAYKDQHNTEKFRGIEDWARGGF